MSTENSKINKNKKTDVFRPANGFCFVKLKNIF